MFLVPLFLVKIGISQSLKRWPNLVLQLYKGLDLVLLIKFY